MNGDAQGGTLWRAQWLWAPGEASPRNAWRCFRKTFVPPDGVSAATLRLTADARYELFVNGSRVGRGPVRSWPFAQAFDSYEVAHLLRPGEVNAVAVLVTHYGVSTFSYVRGRAGLLAQLELWHAGGHECLPSDSSWKTAPHAAFDPRAPRICAQLGFVEHYDARVWDEAWTQPGFGDERWASALELGPVGTPPWTTLVPRDIPFLTDAPVPPVRVASLQCVTPIAFTTRIDLAAQLVPDADNHANALLYAAYLAWTLRLEAGGRVTVGTPLASGAFGRLFVNGEACEPSSDERVTLELPAGEHLLLLELPGHDRGGVGLHLGIDAEVAFTLCSPLPHAPEVSSSGASNASPFVTLGPLDAAVFLDHQPEPVLSFDRDLYRRMAAAATPEELLRYHGWVRPVPARLVGRADVFGACVWVRECIPQPVPAALQALAVANGMPTELPVFGEGDPVNDTAADTEVTLDFGREVSGFLELELDAAAGTVIDLYGFEFMAGDRRQDTDRLDNTLRYTCREGAQRYTSPVRRGFRYLMVTVRGAARAPRLTRVGVRESTYPTPELGAFSCSDALLNDIWQLSRETLRLCMEDTYVDCPAYEQTFWVGDARNAALVNAYIFGADALTRRCLRLVPGSSRTNPLLLDQLPSGWDSVIPNWTFLWVVACLEFFGRTGDSGFVREVYPHVREVLARYLEKRDERGLLTHYGWNFLDWAPMDQPRDGVVAHQNMFLVWALRAASSLAELTEDREGAVAFRRNAETLTAVINAHLWSDTRGAYVDALHPTSRSAPVFSVQTQIAAHLSSVAQGARGEAVAAHLAAPPKDFVAIGSPFVSFFHYEVLVGLDRLDRVLDDIRANYGAMLRAGATTCWEMYPTPERPTRSHCHAWSTAPGFILGAHVLGVQPLTPGWTTVRVAPGVSDLTWAQGRVPHPGGGWVEVAWELHSGALEVTVSAPKGVRVEVARPVGMAGETRVLEL